MKFLTGKKTFDRLLQLSAFMGRRKYLDWLTLPMMRLFGNVTWQMRKGRSRKGEEVDALAKEWQKMFPGAKKYFPLTEVSEDTAYMEIRTKCPLRGTGDTTACYKLMEYDRHMVKKMGGQFVVLSSQSSNETGICRVAIRKQGAEVSDLKEAHLD